jgi:hypothetical protein
MGHGPRWAGLLGVVAVTGLLAFGLGSRPDRAELSGDTAASVPLLGSSVLSPANLASVTQQFGRMPIVRVYFPGLPGPPAWDWIGLNRSAVIVSFKALPDVVLSGADDARLRQFFADAPRGHPIYYSYWHEPEDNIARGQFTLKAYRAAWQRIVKLADAAHNPWLHSTLILMNYDLIPWAHRDWKSYLPPGHIIQVLGWDAYPQGSAQDKDPKPTPPKVFMGPAIAASKKAGLPYGFAEFGLATAKGRARWLTSVGKYLLQSGALFGSLFDGNSQYPSLHLGDAASIAVWRRYVAQSEAAVKG